MKDRAKQQRFEEIDEHDLPTEPIPFQVPTPTEAIAPASPFQEPPFPQQGGWGAYAPTQPVQSRPPEGAYPFLPPAPSVNPRHRPAGGARPEKTPGSRSARVRRGRSPWPGLVGLCFILLQFLLIARFGLVLFNITQGAAWIDIVYAFSNLLVMPFQFIWQNLGLPQLAHLELYTLVAIAVYGLISRLLVRFLKAALN